MFIFVFWTLSSMQVLISIVIHLENGKRNTPASARMRDSQRKDDIVVTLAIASVLIFRSSPGADLVYGLASVAMAWLSHRAKQRLAIMAVKPPPSS
jgi:hypothetical protein